MESTRSSQRTESSKLYAMNEQVDEMVPGGSGDESWSLIWKLVVPPKVKVFWWRVSRVPASKTNPSSKAY
jgi:hypothetical protein